MADGIILIGCGIFQEEAAWVLEREGLDVAVEWLEVGLHDNIERLESVLDEKLREHRKAGGRSPGFLFGGACLPEMKAFAEARGTRALSIRNCLAALVGDAELRELERDRTLVGSPGWVRKMWLGRAGTAGGWQADDYRIQFGRYDRILALDPGINPLTDDEIIACFDLVQVPIEVRPCGLDHFRRVFLELIS